MKTVTAILLGICLILAANAAPATPGTLSFAPTAKAKGGWVTLLDLAAAPGELPDEVKRRLAAVNVVNAPGLGQAVNVSGGKLRLLVQEAKLPKGLTVLLPPQVTVERGSQRISAADLGEAYRDALMRALGPRAKQAELRELSSPRDVLVPEGEVRFSVEFVSGRLAGRVPAVISVLVDGQRAAQARVTGQVEFYATVVVAARALPRQQPLGLEDLELGRVNVTDQGAPLASDPAELVGLRTRQPLAAGAPIALGQLERTPLVHRGDVVNMICVAGGMKITAKGKAEQTGYKDGLIRLTNLASKREVFGKILSQGTVLVTF